MWCGSYEDTSINGAIFDTHEENESNLGVYIAPVNHNKINTGITVNIASTMMGRFAQDDDKDTTQLQEMGLDAGVEIGYNKNHVRTWFYI